MTQPQQQQPNWVWALPHVAISLIYAIIYATSYTLLSARPLLSYRIRHPLVKYCQYPLRPAPHPHGFLPTLIIISRHTFHCQPRRIHCDHSIDIYGEERAVRRLTIILSLKEAYLKAMGQPIGFDCLWINCDITKEVVLWWPKVIARPQ